MAPPPDQPSATRRKFLEPDPETGLRLSDLQRNLIIVGILVAAVVVIVVAVRMAATGDEQSSSALPAYVDRLIPASGSEVLRQATVGIDVAAAHDAYLEINGTPVRTAADGLIKDLGTGLIQYTPGPGKVVEELLPERNCIIAHVWKQEDGEASAAPVSWCFTAS